MTRDDFEQQLDADPANWFVRQAYADWLEEQGDEILANGQRWMVENGKHTHRKYYWSWWNRGSLSDCLQEHIWEALKNGNKRPVCTYRVASYTSRTAAESALAQALHQLTTVTK